MYNFTAVANRLTLAVHDTITKCSTVVTTCSRALPHLTLGDTRCGSKDQDQFLQKSDNPDREGTHTSLPKKSGHLQTRGVTDHEGHRKVVVTVQWTNYCARGT